jgi:Leucine-rich repeat (LRR) protein
MDKKLMLIFFHLIFLFGTHAYSQSYKDIFKNECTIYFDSENYSKAFLCFNGVLTESVINRDTEYSDKCLEWMKRSAHAMEHQINYNDSLLSVTKAFIDNFYFFDNRIALAYKNGKYGFINKEGKTIVDFKFVKAKPFDEETGYAEVVLKDTTYQKAGTNNFGIRRGEFYFWMNPDGKRFPKEKPIESLPIVERKETKIERQQKYIDQFKIENKSIKRPANELQRQFNTSISDFNNGKYYQAYLRLQAVIKESDSLRKKGEELRHLFIDRMNRIFEKTKEGLNAAEEAKKILEAVKNSFDLKSQKFAIAYNNNLYHFIDEEGKELQFMGQWEKATKFYFAGYYEVEIGGNKLVIDTSGIRFPLANSLNELNQDITALDLSKTRLEEFPDEILQNSQLQILILDGTLRNEQKIEVLPEEIATLKKLKILSLNHCALKSFPASISSLEKLEMLLADGNELNSLPSTIGQLKNLKILRAASNLLTTLPKEIGQINKLKYIFLSDNILLSLPDEIKNLQKLDYLDLKKNPPEIDIAVLKQLIPNSTISTDEPLRNKIFAKKFFTSGNYKKAHEYITKYLDTVTSAAEDWFLRSYYALFAEEPQDAIQSANYVLNLPESQNKSIYTNLALGYLLNNQWEEAKNIYEKWKGSRFHVGGEESNELFMKDIMDLEAAGIVHPDFEKVRKIFEN